MLALQFTMTIRNEHVTWHCSVQWLVDCTRVINMQDKSKVCPTHSMSLSTRLTCHHKSSRAKLHELYSMSCRVKQMEFGRYILTVA